MRRDRGNRERARDDRPAAAGLIPTLCCESAERLRDDPRAAAAVDAHHIGCAECRRDAAEGIPIARLLSPAAIAPTAAGSADPLFVPAVLARIRSEPTPLRRRELRARARRALAAAAAIAIAAALFLDADPGEHRAPAAPRAAREASGADRFLLGGGASYLACDWIPAAPARAAESAEVGF